MFLHFFFTSLVHPKFAARKPVDDAKRIWEELNFFQNAGTRHSVKVVAEVVPLLRPLADAFLGMSEKPLPPSRMEAFSSFLSAAAVVSICWSGFPPPVPDLRRGDTDGGTTIISRSPLFPQGSRAEKETANLELLM